MILKLVHSTSCVEFGRQDKQHEERITGSRSQDKGSIPTASD